MMLENIYLEKLSEMFVAEKRYILCLKKLSAAALTDELRKGLLPDSSDQPMHIDRLKLCFEIQNAKKVGIISPLDACFFEYSKDVVKGKVPSLEKDISLLHISQQIFKRKIQGYNILQQMAKALGLEQAIPLLEQCFKDDQNAYNYLVQISQNIIYPKAVIVITI
jgi:ferritin-like metal-binding protein YciE